MPLLAGLVSVGVGIWLTLAVSRLYRAEWAGAPHLPYSPSLLAVPMALGFLASALAVVALHAWIFNRVRIMADRAEAALLMGLAGGVFIAGFVLLCSMFPPWPNLAK